LPRSRTIAAKEFGEQDSNSSVLLELASELEQLEAFEFGFEVCIVCARCIVRELEAAEFVGDGKDVMFACGEAIVRLLGGGFGGNFEGGGPMS
jgi:hypothetical protein